MYEPVRDLLAQEGFTVRGEVKGCDIAATKGDVLWVVEMKLGANITLIYQAMARQEATSWVFVAIPRPKSARDGAFLKLKKLLKKLEIGLILVALDTPIKHAQIVLTPSGRDNKTNKKAVAIRREVAARTVDTTGGTSKQPINTAFRERCIHIACALAAHGPLSAKVLVATHGCHTSTGIIMRTNALGWFTPVSRGIYDISQLGRTYLAQQSATTLVAYYTMKAQPQV